MKNVIFYLSICFFISSLNAQVSSTYSISFDNAVHHEAQVSATFTNLKSNDVELTMSRSSPGRYALHEFVKNVYELNVTDDIGNALQTVKQNPYSWIISGHNGTIHVSYTLFANHGDGTYSQVDETHAHLNMPATFMFVPELKDDKYRVTFDVREDLNWKVATQLRRVENNTYEGRDLQYFLDSPTEISNYGLRSFRLDGQTINLVLHHNGTDVELDQYFESVKAVVKEQKAVFGELPKFDFQNYYFLACYMPNVTGDGMEHRNSTVIPSTRSLAEGGMTRNIGTVSHEFFHCWNVERIRPADLEPFNFVEANMSEGLWFAEGITSYYTGLTLCRAGLRSQEDYIKGLTGTFNYVWNSPGRKYFNAIEMSQQAPFVDAARSVDPNNRSNTFISYYSYGSALGLALDLALREKNLNLDDYMKMLWFSHGKEEKPYVIEDLRIVLQGYAGKEFADNFFNNYVHKSGMPEMERLFKNVGVSLVQNIDNAWFGRALRDKKVARNTIIDSPAYKAGLENGDLIISIGDFILSDTLEFTDILNNFKPGDVTTIVFERHGKRKETEITFGTDPNYSIELLENLGTELTESQKLARDHWLKSKE
jgi:predicted metalloprotease with PDZ domain